MVHIHIHDMKPEMTEETNTAYVHIHLWIPNHAVFRASQRPHQWCNNGIARCMNDAESNDTSGGLTLYKFSTRAIVVSQSSDPSLLSTRLPASQASGVWSSTSYAQYSACMCVLLLASLLLGLLHACMMSVVAQPMHGYVLLFFALVEGKVNTVYICINTTIGNRLRFWQTLICNSNSNSNGRSNNNDQVLTSCALFPPAW